MEKPPVERGAARWAALHGACAASFPDESIFANRREMIVGVRLKATPKVESSSSIDGAVGSRRLRAGAGVDRNAASPGFDGASDAFARAHGALLRGKDLQFEPTAAPKPPNVPDWLLAIGKVLADVAPFLAYVFWGCLILGAALILYFLLRELITTRWPSLKPNRGPVLDDEVWRPSAAKARTLLEDADRLAAAGRFAEAVHLILFRSIEDIEGKRPDLIKPALTSRDIAQLDGVPERVRRTFSEIARVVERSFFGGRSVGAEEFAVCRKAYEGFAFAEAWR